MAKSGKTRRELLKGAVAAGLVGVSGDAGAQQADANAITPEDIAAADKLAGRSYTDEERAQMARRLAGTREGVKAIREASVEELAER